MPVNDWYILQADWAKLLKYFLVKFKYYEKV